MEQGYVSLKKALGDVGGESITWHTLVPHGGCSGPEGKMTPLLDQLVMLTCTTHGWGW